MSIRLEYLLEGLIALVIITFLSWGYIFPPPIKVKSPAAIALEEMYDRETYKLIDKQWEEFEALDARHEREWSVFSKRWNDKE